MPKPKKQKNPKNPKSNKQTKPTQKPKKLNMGFSHIFFCACRWRRTINEGFHFTSFFNVSKIITWVGDYGRVWKIPASLSALAEKFFLADPNKICGPTIKKYFCSHTCGQKEGLGNAGQCRRRYKSQSHQAKNIVHIEALWADWIKKFSISRFFSQLRTWWLLNIFLFMTDMLSLLCCICSWWHMESKRFHKKLKNN